MKTKEPIVVTPTVTANNAAQNDARNETTVNARGDAELKERINTFLHQRNEAPLRRLRVDVCNGHAVIGGVVRTFYQKQLAGHCCQRVAGVQNVVNNVTVEP
ncbi:MAG: BON domain-containing protein [Pirellulales bacterium]